MNKNATKVIKYSLSFILAAVLVYFAFRGINWTEFLNDIKQTRWGYVALFSSPPYWLLCSEKSAGGSF